MMERWHGRVALVTGASSGIGAGIARCLATNGMKVVACARNIGKIQEMADELFKSNSPGEVLAVRCDLRQESEILSMFQRIRDKYDRIDVCVNCAGLSWPATLLEGATEQWREMFEVNVLALSICTREAVKLMRERGIDDGQVIHISSMSGYRLTTKDINFYSCTKHAVRALTEGLRGELHEAGSHIRIASISPANVTTEMMARTFAGTETPYTGPTFKELDVSDIVDAAVYILSAKPHVQVHDVLIRGVEQAT